MTSTLLFRRCRLLPGLSKAPQRPQMHAIRVWLVISIIVVLSLPVLPLSVQAQTKAVNAPDAIAKSFAVRYKDKTLTLRQFYKDSTIRFKREGTIQAGRETGTWTLYGLLKIFDVKSRKNEIELRGTRQVVLIHQPNGALQQSNSRTIVRVIIEFDPAASIAQQVGVAMSQVFLSEGESVAEVVPYYWKEYFEFRAEMAKAGIPFTAVGTSLGSGQGCNPLQKDKSNIEPMGAITPPKLIKKVDPKFPNEAVNLKISGTVVFRGLIQKNGHAAELRLMQAVGAAFDEAAMQAVSDWIYEPARLNGEPVETESCISISFHFG